MDNFGGEFKRKPQQSYGGVSTKQSKESLMQKAAEERKKREDHKRRAESSIIIQAFFRSYKVRTEKKLAERMGFDSLIGEYKAKVSTKRQTTTKSMTQNGTLENELNLIVLLSRKFNFFNQINDEDDQTRLVNLSQIIITKQMIVISNLSTSSTLLINLKKLLVSCCRLIQTLSRNSTQSLAIPLRMLEIFTDNRLATTSATTATTTSTTASTTTTTTYSSSVDRKTLSNIKQFLCANGYFTTIHHLLVHRLPPSIQHHNFDAVTSRIPMAMTICNLLSRFLEFDLGCDDESYRQMILWNAVIHLFNAPISTQIKYFLLPTLSSTNFPYVDLLRTLQQSKLQQQQQQQSLRRRQSQQKYFPTNFVGKNVSKMTTATATAVSVAGINSSLGLLYCLLVLGQPHFDKLPPRDLALLLSVLDDQMKQFNYILCSKKNNKKLLSIPDDGDDGDDDNDEEEEERIDDDDDDDAMDWEDDKQQTTRKAYSDLQLKQLCIELLGSNVDLANNLFKQLVNPSSGFCDVNDDVSSSCSASGGGGLLSLCRICYRMLLHNRKMAIHKIRLLNVLSFNPSFIEKVWFLISTIHTKSVLNEKTYLLQSISRGSNLADADFNRFIPLISIFSTTFNHYLLTISDAEFHGKIGTKKVMPFDNLTSISQVSLSLRDFCLGVIELTHPEFRAASNIASVKFDDDNVSVDGVSGLAFFSTPLRRNATTTAVKSTSSRVGLVATKMSASNLTTYSRTASYTDQFVARQRELLLVFKDAVRLLKQLYERDCRERYCPPGCWLASSNLYHSEKFVQPLSSSAREYVSCPFGTLSILNSDDANLRDDRPILSTSEVRKLIILSELPFVISFQDRVKIFHDLVRRDKAENQSDHVGFYGNAINIRRNYLYEDAFEKLSPENEPNLKVRLQVKLINAAGLDEAGVDGGGLFREFMAELVKTGFDPNLGFFKTTPDKLLYPNFQANLLWRENYLKHYFFLGRILGKVIYENMLIEVPFASFFLAKLLSRHKGLLDMHYLASLDPELHRNLLFIKDYEGDVSEMQLDFAVNYDVLGELKVDELKPNGKNIQVTNSNRFEYVYLMADYKLNKQIRQHCIAFREGLAQVLNISWLRMFDHNELQILISGANIPIDVDDLKRHTNYSGGYTAEHSVIQMFWNVVDEFDNKQRQQLLKFVTSCSRPPLMGFKELYPAFCIHHAGNDLDRLPTSSTCMNLLKLPEFKDEESLKQKLLYAIESGAGFELS